MADMRISELTTAAGLHDGDLFETSQTDSISSSGYASYKTSLSAIAAFIAKQVQFSGDLQTTSKTLIGAINEVFNAGTSVTVTNVLPATETTKRVATITVDGVAKDINADDTVKVITDLKTPKNATITNGIAQFECIEENLVKGLKVTMNPIQDLHGYSNPWVGGAGKNKFQTTATSQTVNGTVFTVNEDGSVTIKNTPNDAITSYTFGIFTLKAGTYKANGFSGGASNNIRLNFRRTSDSASLALIYNNRDIEFTIEEDTKIRVYPIVPIDFDGNEVTMYPMIRLSTVTDATFAPYSNICPISGRTEASVTRTGKNLIIGKLAGMTISSLGRIVFSSYDTYIIKTKAGQKYTGSGNGESIGTYWAEFENYPSGGDYSINGARQSGNTATATIDGYIAMRFTQDATKPQIELGETITAYEPPVTPETYTHQYSETIYGGEDDFVNGEATSTMVMVDMGNIEWGYNTGYTYPYFNAKLDIPTPSAGYDYGICSQYEVLPARTSSNFRTTDYDGKASWIYDQGNYNFAIQDSRYTSLSDFVTAMSGVQLCYELGTPTTIETSAEEITTVAGTNIISGTEPISECKYTELATVDDLIKIIGGQ